MTLLIIYSILSAIMSICYSTLIYRATDLGGFSKTTRIWFFLYFFVANLLAWPMYGIYMASYVLHDYKK